MPKFNNDDISAAMEDPTIIRNIVTAGALGVGKTCALDCLGARCGIIPMDKISEARFALARPDERERGCTLKLNVTSMVVEDMLLHVMDTPGHPEHAAEFSAALPLADGALVVVDGSGGGMATHTFGQVKELVKWVVEPVLFCNRLDISIFVTQKTPEEISSDLADVVQMFCSELDSCTSPLGEAHRVDVVAGNVLFGSLAQGWAFTLPQMAEMYASKFGVEVEKMAERFWGDNFFKPSKKSWSTVQQEGSVQGFVHFVLKPINQVADACMAHDIEKLEKMMTAMGVTMTAADLQLEGKILFRRVMQMWLPAGLAIARTCQRFVPNPVTAQARRFSVLSTAPVNDPSALAVKECSPVGPLHFQIVKMTPQPGNASRFYCIGRVFSGTLVADKCFMLQEDYLPPHCQSGILAEEGVVNDVEFDDLPVSAIPVDEIFPDADLGPAPRRPEPIDLPAEDYSASSPEVSKSSDRQVSATTADGSEKSSPLASFSESPSSSARASPSVAPASPSTPLAAVPELPAGGRSPTSLRGSPKAGKGRASSFSLSSSMQSVRVQAIASCASRAFNAIKAVPAGNICAVSGVDQFVLKRGTLASSADDFPLRPPVFTVSPVVRMSVQPASVADLPKMVDGLRRLAKSCPLVQISTEDTGSHIVAGCGEEHMRVLQRDLTTLFLAGVNLTWGAPRVSYREVVTGESSQVCLAKSPNKHNRIYITAEPMSELLCQDVEAQRIFPTQDFKKRGKILEKQFSWDKADSIRIWGFGPAPEESGAAHGPNILVDQTKGIQYLHEIRESVNSGLLWASKQGPLCEEKMRGVRFNLQDAKLHSDSIHRGMGQIQPPARRAFFSSVLTARCRLAEPMFHAAIEAPESAQAGIMQALGVCRGELVITEETGMGRVSVQAYVPIAETIGSNPFATVLTQKTNGKASVSYAFDHWETIPSDPLAWDPKTGTPASKAAEILMSIRQQKGIKLEPPKLADFLDKL